jgi:hypothetical protein
MTRRTVLLQVGIYAAITIAAGLIWGLGAFLVVGFLSAIVLVVGFALLSGGNWLRDASSGRFDRRGRDS